MSTTYQILLVAFFLSVLSSNFVNSEEDPWCLLWEDNFSNDTLNTDIWEFELGDGCQYGNNLCGWGNQELEWYTDSDINTRVSNGTLVISVYKDQIVNDRQYYTSARLRTKNHKDWRYGKVEIRAQIPKGRGIWPAIWMLPTNNTYGTWPRSGEIDIMEVQGQHPEKLFATAHFGEAWNNKTQKGTVYTLPSGDFSQDFHVYSIEWEENAIQWFVDGHSLLNFVASESKPFIYPFNEDFHLLINVAVGGNFVGAPDNSTEFPQMMFVDYVRVYQKNCTS